jgi:transposase
MKPNQCHAVVLLATGQSQIDVATQLKVHPETIRNWLKKTDFRAMLASETRIVLEKQRNSSSQAFLDQIARLKKCAQNRAQTSTHREKPRNEIGKSYL